MAQQRAGWVTAEELAEREDLWIADLRFRLSDPGWGRAAHRRGRIPGARYLDLDQDLSGELGEPGPGQGPVGGRHPLPAARALEETLRRLGLRQGQTVCVYDEGSGAFAARLWWMLRWLGHDELLLLQGGWGSWEAAGLPAESGPTEPPPRGDWLARPRPELLVSATAAAAAETLVDCRSAERYLGVHEPIDPVPGHIPGARHCFWKDALAAVQEGRPSGIPGCNPVLYCGSGVTACASLLALHLEGREGRLYAGSWSDWLARGGAVERGVE